MMSNTTIFADNISRSDESFQRSDFLIESPEIAISTIVVTAAAGIIGTFGNFLILLAVAKNENLRTVECILIVNLAISDLFITVVGDPMSVIAKLEGEEFFERVPGLCRTIGSVCTVSCLSAVLTITTMCLNRYLLICHHNAYRKIFTRKGCIMICISFYIIGIFLVLLNTVGIGNHGFNQKSLECIWDRMFTYHYTVVWSAAFILVPITVTGVLYLRIYIFVAKSKTRVKINLGNSESKNQMFKLAKSLFIISTVFALCWMPYALLVIIDFENKYSQGLHVSITTLAHLHPSLNWLVYYFTNRKFTMAFNKFIPVRSCRKSVSVPKTSPSNTNTPTGEHVLSYKIATQSISFEMVPSEIN